MKRKRKKGKSDTLTLFLQKGPARAVIDESPHRMVGEIDYPPMMDYPAAWEASLERKLILLLLVCEGVSGIAAQPETLPYQEDDGEHKYTADLAITSPRGRIYIEVKPLRYLIGKENLAKYVAIARSFRSQNRQLEFITDDQIREPWFKNAKLLRRYLRHPLWDGAAQRCGEILQSGQQTIAEILSAAGAPLTLADVYALIAHRALCIDWEVRLGRGAPVSLPGKPFGRLTYDRIRSAGRFPDLLEEMALGRRPPDQRLLAAARARRRPLSCPSPVGFVDGLTAAQLGHLMRRSAAASHQSPGCEASTHGTGVSQSAAATDGG